LLNDLYERIKLGTDSSSTTAQLNEVQRDFLVQSKILLVFAGTVYEGTSNIQLTTIAKCMDDEG
jgi:hypothetical protein